MIFSSTLRIKNFIRILLFCAVADIFYFIYFIYFLLLFYFISFTHTYLFLILFYLFYRPIYFISVGQVEEPMYAGQGQVQTFILLVK